MIKDNTQEEKDEELIEMAAEQFARLFWKQWLLKKESEKSKSQNQNRNKSDI